jgi:hypothetical protein
MLKLEPTEAEKVLVALPHRREFSSLLSSLDTLIRAEDQQGAADLADRTILRRGLGLSATECATLREAADEMQKWRMHK